MPNAITPAEARARQQAGIPDAVFEVFNRLLSERIAAGIVNITQREVVAALAATIREEELYARCWLDVEPYYRERGWKVTYDRPGYNESYDANWTFKPRD